MDFRQLATFVEAAKQLNFTKASTTLGYAQSTVTIHIQTLEEELKTQLFERIGKQIKLTVDGQQFYAYAEKLLNLSNEAKDVISSSVSPKGVIELGTAESLCIYRLSDVLIDFRALYPDVEVKIRFDTSDDFYQHLRKNIVDVAIVLDNRCVADDIVTHVLAEEPMVVIAAAGHPLARKKRVLPKDLQGQPLILTEDSCSYHLLFESILYQSQVRPGSVMSLSSLEVIKKFVSHNWGFGFLPRATVEAEVAAGKLSVLAWAGPSFSVTSQLLYHKDKWISPALKAFNAFAIERMRLRTKRRRNLEQAGEICVVASKTIKRKLGQKRQEGDGLPWMARRKLPVLDKIDQNKARIDSLRPMPRRRTNILSSFIPLSTAMGGWLVC